MTEQDALAYWTIGLVTASVMTALSILLLLIVWWTSLRIEHRSQAALKAIMRMQDKPVDAKLESANHATRQLNTAIVSVLARASQAVTAQQESRFPRGNSKEENKR